MACGLLAWDLLYGNVTIQDSSSGFPSLIPRKPVGVYINFRAVREVGHPAAIYIDYEDIAIALKIGPKSDPGPIRRPLQVQLRDGIVGEAGHPTAIGVHHIEIFAILPYTTKDDTTTPPGVGFIDDGKNMVTEVMEAWATPAKPRVSRIAAITRENAAVRWSG
jgi:hypothetical protein